VRDTIRFLLGDQPRELRQVSPTLTVLEYLRGTARLTGTKEGCAEGDCGACTVVLGEATPAGLRQRAVNACIIFVPALDGKQLLTVEHLRQADGALHPVQQAMVDGHASQCGFCTPGFVMSLYALHQADGAPDRTEVNDALAGNLCRCTGYRPIVDAALHACAERPTNTTQTVEQLRALDTADTLSLTHGGQTYIAPRSTAELAETLRRHPDAVLLAGGTDVGLWVTKQHRDLATIVALDVVADLAGISEADGAIRIGGGANYEDALDAIEAHYPDLGSLIRRIGSRQIRNRGTIGGNIGNASPIGDMPPALIALGATLVLRSGTQRRLVLLEDFFTGYRRTVLAPGEFIERIDIPAATADREFRCYKVAKRFDQDISAVCGAFRLERADGTVRDIRIGFGGVAATPARARNAEAALLGKSWTEASVHGAMAALDTDFAPISDMRASAAYRRTVARNLLFKFFLETGATAPRTRLEVPA
jgi:xanthine dehydrogenase small subunit